MAFSLTKNPRGFTIIELMMVIAIITILTGIVLQHSRSLNTVVELENAVKNVDIKIRTAKTRSIGALNDKNYGVHFEASKAVIYDATGIYVDGAPGNEVYDLPQNVEIYDISIIGSPDMVFDRLTGNTANFGSIGLRSVNDATKTKTIFINANGQNSFSSFATSAVPALTNARHAHFDLGWNIENSDKLIFRWYDASDALILEKQIDAAAYFNVGQTEFHWEGTINESGINQKITVNSWLDGSNNTVLDIIRHNTEDDKLKVYFNKAGEKHVATYTNTAGVITLVAGPDGGTVTIQ